MTSDALTVVVGIVGVVASLGFSLLFYWLGKRSARKEKTEMFQEIRDLEALLSAAFREMSEQLPSKRDIGRILGLGSGFVPPASGVADESRTDQPGVAISAIVQASLGSLVNEHGEVSVPRLLREVGNAVGSARLSEIVAVLADLRSAGAIDWEGYPTDASQVRVIRVRTGQGRDVETGTGITPQSGSNQ